MSGNVTSTLKAAAKGTTFVFTGMAVSQVLWFTTKLLLVRSLSKEDLGIYSLILALTSIIALLASLGLWQGSTRYISIFSGQGKKEDADAVRRSTLIIGAIAGGGACALMFLLSGVLSRSLFYKPELSAPLMIMSLSVPAYVMAMNIASVLRGYGSISPTVYFIDIGQPFFFLLFLVPVFFFNLPFISVFYSYVLSAAVICALIAHYGRRKAGPGPSPSPGADNYVRELLKFSIPVLSIDIMFLLFRWVDTLMLGRYGTAVEVGAYSVGVSLAVLLNLPLIALGFVYLPIAGELYAKNRMPDLARTYQVLTKWVLAVTLPIFFILFFFPGMTISFLFGDRFADSVLPLRILSLGYLFTTFMGTNSMLLLVFGLSRAVMKVSAAGALLDVLLNYFLIKHAGLGTAGASLATSISLIAVGIGYSFVLYRHSRIHPVSAGCLKPAIASVVSGAVIYAVVRGLALPFWMLPVYFLLYTGGYVASLFLTRSLDDEDVFLLEQVLSRAGIGPEMTRRVIGKIYKGNTGKLI
ncbi:MAG: flippase [Nitrospirae bacterium]|nr:flippase [Nitrospirota bacterium]